MAKKVCYIINKQKMLELQKQSQQVVVSITQIIKPQIKKDALIGHMSAEEFVMLVGRSNYQDAIKGNN
jgi:GGDEF domain-containing protein